MFGNGSFDSNFHVYNPHHGQIAQPVSTIPDRANQLTADGSATSYLPKDVFGNAPFGGFNNGYTYTSGKFDWLFSGVHAGTHPAHGTKHDGPYFAESIPYDKNQTVSK